jgi:hypothetical protein
MEIEVTQSERALLNYLIGMYLVLDRISPFLMTRERCILPCSDDPQIRSRCYRRSQFHWIRFGYSLAPDEGVKNRTLVSAGTVEKKRVSLVANGVGERVQILTWTWCAFF